MSFSVNDKVIYLGHDGILRYGTISQDHGDGTYAINNGDGTEAGSVNKDKIEHTKSIKSYKPDTLKIQDSNMDNYAIGDTKKYEFQKIPLDHVFNKFKNYYVKRLDRSNDKEIYLDIGKFDHIEYSKNADGAVLSRYFFKSDKKRKYIGDITNKTYVNSDHIPELYIAVNRPGVGGGDDATRRANQNPRKREEPPKKHKQHI